MEVKPTYLGTMIALATAAFGLIAALAWNKFITDLIARFLGPGAACGANSCMPSSSLSSLPSSFKT